MSPASLAAVAASLDLGASPRFRDAMRGTLGFPEGDAEADFASLRGSLRSVASASGPLKLADLVVVDTFVSGVVDLSGETFIGLDPVAGFTYAPVKSALAAFSVG